MSARALLRPQAERDLIAIWCHIARDNPDAADRVRSPMALMWCACSSVIAAARVCWKRASDFGARLVEIG